MPLAPEARWSHLQSRAKGPTIGLIIDNAMTALERDNPKLKGVLPRNYAREQIDKATLGGLIDPIGNINFRPTPLPSLNGRGSEGEGRPALGRLARFPPSDAGFPILDWWPAEWPCLLHPAEPDLTRVSSGRIMLQL